MKKLIFFLLAFIPITTFSQSWSQCGCTIGTDPFFAVVITYATESTASCAVPSPGLALVQLYIAGQSRDDEYMDIQQAANECQLHDEMEFLEIIIGPFLDYFASGSSGDQVIMTNGEDMPYTVDWTYDYNNDYWTYTIQY
ncbi:MAG: hypothetical protein JWP94_1217 [Mucilaginibacter sp.]|jgi:hypothetical protein|nr:hypothetical protein [Mucilaginibacter sp.]